MAYNPENKKEHKTDEDRLNLLKTRLKLAKAFCEKPHKAWKTYIGEYEIDDIDDSEVIRDKVRIGYIFRKVESELPHIFDDQPDLFIKARKPNIKPLEPAITGVYDYLWDIQNLEEVIEDTGLYFELLGMGFVETPWVTKTKKVQEPVTVADPVTGEEVPTGELNTYDVPVYDAPRAYACDPFKVFFSPETKFNRTLDYEHCPYYFKETVMSIEEIKAKFNKEVDTQETLKLDDSSAQADLDRDLQGTGGEDLKRATVYEYYGCLPEKYAKDIDGAWEYDKDYHIFLTNNEELLVEENPYESKPLKIVGNYGLANKFFKFGDAKHLRLLVKELEVYRSQLLKHTRKMVNPKILTEESSNVNEDRLRDPREGQIVSYKGKEPSYMQPPSLGAEVGVGIERVTSDLEKQSGTFDLYSGNSQSTVKTPRGIAVYSEAADKSIRQKRKRIARLIRELIMFQFKQVSQFWSPEDERAVNVIGEGGEEELTITAEVLEVLSGVNDYYSLDIEIESLTTNKVQMRQDSLDLWDTASQHPEVFNLRELGRDLLENGFDKKDADRYMTPMLDYIMQAMQKDPEIMEAVGQEYMQIKEEQQLFAPIPEDGDSQPQPEQAL